MPPKKAAAAAPKAKASSSAPAHASYRDMIKEAIMALKERNGSSRSALKKYILANNKNVTPGATFDSQFNRAVKAGADKEEFALPKGPSGTVKLNKKTSVPTPKAEKPAAKKPAAAKKTTTTTKTAAPKKAGAPKKTATKAKAAPKKAAATKTKAAAKPKANTSTKRAKKTPTAAPAVVDEKKVLGKTKSGRVTKNKTEPAKPSTKKTPKKAAAAPKKAASAKKATPKKADAPVAAA